MEQKSIPFLTAEVFLLVSIVLLPSLARETDSELAAFLLEKAGMAGGICSLPRCGEGQLAVDLATSSRFLVHGLDSRPDRIAAARRRARDAGLLGPRVVIEPGGFDRLPYADNLVDLIVLADFSAQDASTLNRSEVLRVLRPGGKAILGVRSREGGGDAPELKSGLTQMGWADAPVWENALGVWTEITKPPLEGADSWSHWYHNPDNNPASTDTALRPPYMTQWLGRPYNVAMPTTTTAAGGRIFVATGHIAHHPREIPTLNLLTARNGYNGQVLWTRKLPEGYLVHRSAFIATDDVFYLIDGQAGLMLDPETGKEIGRFQIPGLQGFWNWMALQEGVLYVQAGEEWVPAKTTDVQSGADHWSWGRLSPGYYQQPRVPWGFGRHLAAYDLREQKTRWLHTEPQPIDSRALGVEGDRVFFYAPESRIGCLDAPTGQLRWVNDDPEVLAKIEQPGKNLVSTPGFRSSCLLLCTEKVLFFQGQTRQNVVAVSAEDGRFLWARSKKRNDPTLLFLDGHLITSHENTTQVLDPLTGEILQTLGFNKVNCTRMTATPDSLFCRGEGLGRYDRNEGWYGIDGSVRPGCSDGAIPANGLLYVGPWCCDCNLSLIGTVTLCSAGNFPVAQGAREEDQLAVGAGDIQHLEPLDATSLDWPTYRANNQRSAASKAWVPEKVQPAWTYQPDSPCRITPPAAVAERLFFGREDGMVQCLDLKTGKLIWEFITGGPIMYPPTIWENRALVGSGDGYIYALEAATGRLLWRFRAAPVQRKIMVYGSLCSTWPVNSGVLVQDGVAYAVAGIVDRDGTYVYALDARTGKILWQNNSSGHLDERLRKGVSGQGILTVARGKLWLAAGNQVSPTAFDLQTGECFPSGQPRGAPSTLRGAEIGVWMDRWLIHGGRLLYSDPGKVVSPGQFRFVPLDEEGRPKPQALAPIKRSSVPPAWDDEIIVALTDRYNQLVCWDNDLLLQAVRVRQEEERLRQEAARRNPNRGQRNRKFWATDPLLDQLFRHTGRWGPVERDTLGVVLASNAVVTVSGPAPWNREENAGRWMVLGFDAQDGEPLWEHRLPSPPLANGLLIDREGKVIIALQNGEVYCLEGA